MKSKKIAHAAIEKFVEWGVRDFIICAGSRNSLLVAEILAGENLRAYNFFEERSAAFFALGLSRNLCRPVAVVSTSGTAAAEFLPAAIEAFYSSVPLLVLTADRPSSYRGTGAPQSIEQVGLFSHFVEASLDWEDEVGPGGWAQRSPLHVNICLEEAKPSDEAPEFWTPTEKLSSASVPLKKNPKVEAHAEAFAALSNLLNQSKKPLVILGGIPASKRAFVEAFLFSTGLPVYAEAPSGLRESELLSSQIIKSGERFLGQAGFDGVLRLGSVPQLRYWRDLEEKKFPVLSFDERVFSGLARKSQHFNLPFEILATWKLSGSPNGELMAQDEIYYQRKLELLSRHPESEVGLFHRLSRHIQEESLVFLGNSLPVREWDLAAHFRPRGHQIFASRGANGIDGQISTFLGLSAAMKEKQRAWGIFGDLTALYDLAAPWILQQLPERDRFIVVINNGGGRIFERVAGLKNLFSDEDRKRVVENEHEIKFEGFAKLWNLGYERWTSIPHLGVASSPSVIEICPNADQSRDFWEDYREIFKK